MPRKVISNGTAVPVAVSPVPEVEPLPAAEPAKRPPLFRHYRVHLTFLTKLCGSVPGDPELVKAWIDARKPRVQPPGSRSLDEIQEEVFTSLATPEAEEEMSLLVFQRHGGQCVLRASTFRSHLKDCARVLSAQWIGRIQGERAFSTRVVNGVYPDPGQYWLPITRPDGSPVTKHDGEMDKPIHVRGPTGQPQNALKRFQWIEPAALDITLWVVGDSVRESDLEHLLTYGGVHGYGGERGDGEGKYTFTLESLDDEEKNNGRKGKGRHK